MQAIELCVPVEQAISHVVIHSGYLIYLSAQGNYWKAKVISQGKGKLCLASLPMECHVCYNLPPMFTGLLDLCSYPHL